MLKDGTCMKEDASDTTQMVYIIDGKKGLTMGASASETFDDPPASQRATNRRYTVLWTILRKGMAEETHLPAVIDLENYIMGKNSLLYFSFCLQVFGHSKT